MKKSQLLALAALSILVGVNAQANTTKNRNFYTGIGCASLDENPAHFARLCSGVIWYVDPSCYGISGGNSPGNQLETADRAGVRAEQQALERCMDATGRDCALRPVGHRMDYVLYSIGIDPREVGITTAGVYCRKAYAFPKWKN
jgi:hypothetical protein